MIIAIKELSLKLRFLYVFIIVVIIFSSDGVYAEGDSSKGKRTFSNIMIIWEVRPVDNSLNVTITMGSALIEVMYFTPDTLQQSLNYSNGQQSATGNFIVIFNALGNGGKLYVKNLKWKTISDEGNISTLIGIWNITK